MVWLRLLGYVWAVPLTILGFIYVLPFTVMGWYVWIGVRDGALVWKVDNERVPGLVRRIWRGWGAQTLGNIIVTRLEPDSMISVSIMRHARAHMRQHMRLGVFFPFFYLISMLGLWLIGGHPYYDHPFEISARREARQYIDLVGLFDKVKSRGHRQSGLGIYRHNGDHTKGHRVG